MSTAAVDRGTTVADEINDSLSEILADDDRALIMGEDVGAVGGVFRITRGLQPRFGADRVIDMPLSEAGIVGTAIGLALNGFRPIVEIQFDGFVYPALNQIIGHMARFPGRLDYRQGLPLLIRLPIGGRIGAAEFHSESPEAIFAHSPELHVVAASTPDTARGLLRAAYSSDDAYIFLEPKRLYRRYRCLRTDVVSQVDPTKARVLHTGSDVTVVTYGPCVPDAIEASQALANEGLSVGVVDLVSLAPLDLDTVFEEVSSSGRLVTVTEAVPRCSVASEIVASVSAACWSSLKAAPRLVAPPNLPPPPPTRENEYFPDTDTLISAIRKAVS